MIHTLLEDIGLFKRLQVYFLLGQFDLFRLISLVQGLLVFELLRSRVAIGSLI